MKTEKRPGVKAVFASEDAQVSPTFIAKFSHISEKFDLSNKPRRPNRCQPIEGPVITEEMIESSISQMKDGMTVEWETVKNDLSL